MPRPSTSTLAAATLAVLLVALAACEPGPAPPPRPDYAARRAGWGTWKTGRDELFRGPESPLPAAEREAFTGLPYFDYDSTFTLNLRLSTTPIADTAYLATTGGPPRPYVPAGAVRFTAGGAENRLTVYRPTGTDDDGTLFIPFTDATSGEETYGGGRYLNLSPSPNGVYVVDFNMAYHPYCVYNPAYVCPVPPRENRMEARITAGERLRPGHAGPPAG